MPGREVTERDNFSYLLAGLIVFLFSSALFAQLNSDLGQRLMNVSLMLTMIVAVWTMHKDKGGWLNWKIGLALLFGSLMIGENLFGIENLALAELLIALVFMALTTWLAAKQVLFSGHVDSNKIIGSICIYILLAIVWALAYLLVEQLFPGSLKGFASTSWQGNVQEAIYFSGVTLTTLGYGDITPVGPVVRFLAYMEAMTGVFYTTVLVASLIGIRLATIEVPGKQKEDT